MAYSATLAFPNIKVAIITQAEALCRIDFKPLSFPDIVPQQAIAKTVVEQLTAYQHGKLQQFDLPLELTGTAFQKKVWQALTTIPYGTTQCYQQLATTLKTSPRPIGNACRHNPIPLIIPCHRVVAKHHIGGFAGQQQGELLRFKQWLLHHEASL